MPVLELLTSSGLGSLLGMRHALEPDHLAAVSTMVTRERGGWKAALIGACWGLGHTLSLLVVGAVHGLAGSGALTALVLTTLPTMAARITYISLFGLGSTLGMAALSGVLGWPMARLGSNHTVGRGISLAVGCGSIGLGLVWG